PLRRALRRAFREPPDRETAPSSGRGTAVAIRGSAWNGPEAGSNLSRSFVGYSGAPMAVPKKKTSKSRRDKRRATHRLEAPRVNTCPQCGRPKQPHRMGPNCKTYAGREIEPLRTPAP